MVDIWGRFISALKSTETSSDDIKKLIEDKIAETLNLTSVDPDELIVFQDRQGKLKSSNVSLGDVLTRRLEEVNEDSIALYTSDGKLKPGESISTMGKSIFISAQSHFSNSIKTFSDRLDSQATSIANVTKSTAEIQTTAKSFLGDLLVPIPNLATIKTTIDTAILRTEYDTHITQFSRVRTLSNRTDDVVSKFFNLKNVKPEDVKITIDDIVAKLDENKASTGNQKQPTSDVVNKFFEGSKLEDITRNFSNINGHIQLQHERKYNEILYHLFRGNQDDTIIEPSYVSVEKSLREIYETIKDIHRQLSYLKFAHCRPEHIKDNVYVVDKGVLNWIKDDIRNIGSVLLNHGGAGIYRMTWGSDEHFDLARGGKVYSGNTAMLIFDNRDLILPFSFRSVKDTVVRAKISWCLEFVSRLTIEEIQGF